MSKRGDARKFMKCRAKEVGLGGSTRERLQAADLLKVERADDTGEAASKDAGWDRHDEDVGQRLDIALLQTKERGSVLASSR